MAQPKEARVTGTSPQVITLDSSGNVSLPNAVIPNAGSVQFSPAVTCTIAVTSINPGVFNFGNGQLQPGNHTIYTAQQADTTINYTIAVGGTIAGPFSITVGTVGATSPLPLEINGLMAQNPADATIPAGGAVKYQLSPTAPPTGCYAHFDSSTPFGVSSQHVVVGGVPALVAQPAGSGMTVGVTIDTTPMQGGSMVAPYNIKIGH